MDVRDLLDAITEYGAVKQNAELHREFITEQEADDQLNAIAAKFQLALSAHLNSVPSLERGMELTDL